MYRASSSLMICHRSTEHSTPNNWFLKEQAWADFSWKSKTTFPWQGHNSLNYNVVPRNPCPGAAVEEEKPTKSLEEYGPARKSRHTLGSIPRTRRLWSRSSNMAPCSGFWYLDMIHPSRNRRHTLGSIPRTRLCKAILFGPSGATLSGISEAGDVLFGTSWAFLFGTFWGVLLGTSGAVLLWDLQFSDLVLALTLAKVNS